MYKSIRHLNRKFRALKIIKRYQEAASLFKLKFVSAMRAQLKPKGEKIDIRFQRYL